MEEHHPYSQSLEGFGAGDLADRLERTPPEEAVDLVRELPADQLADAILQMDVQVAARLLELLPTDAATLPLQFLPPNLIVDLAVRWPSVKQAEILATLPREKAAAVAALLPYAPDTAGGIMDNRFIAVLAGDTIEQCLRRIRGTPTGQRSDEVAYVYVVDPLQHLVGVVTLRDLIFNSPECLVSEIMNRDVRFLRVTDDQEEVARRIQQNGLLALPVVDAIDRLVGVVKMRDAIRVAETEATEDMQLMVGLSGEERIWTPWNQSIRMRLPWLGVNLGTALGAAAVVSLFESTIARWTALVAFLPLICAVAGNAGNQALTVIIRSFALGEVTAGDASRALRKELAIGAINGLVLALAIGLLAVGWKGSILLGAVAGAAMLLNQIIGALSGVAVPLGLKWWGTDPALASSILVTALTDTMGFLIFLGLAALGRAIFSI